MRGWPTWDTLPVDDTPVPAHAGVDYLPPDDLDSLTVDIGVDYDLVDLDTQAWAPRRAARRTHSGEHEDLAALVGARPSPVERCGGIA